MGTTIGAGGNSGGGYAVNAVKYVAQSLTDAQKTQARTNIGALSATDSEDESDVIAAALLELDARIKAIEQRLSPDGNLGKVNVDELSVIKTFNNYTV